MSDWRRRRSGSSRRSRLRRSPRPRRRRSSGRRPGRDRIVARARDRAGRAGGRSIDAPEARLRLPHRAVAGAIAQADVDVPGTFAECRGGGAGARSIGDFDRAVDRCVGVAVDDHRVAPARPDRSSVPPLHSAAKPVSDDQAPSTWVDELIAVGFVGGTVSTVKVRAKSSGPSPSSSPSRALPPRSVSVAQTSRRYSPSGSAAPPFRASVEVRLAWTAESIATLVSSPASGPQTDVSRVPSRPPSTRRKLELLSPPTTSSSKLTSSSVIATLVGSSSARLRHRCRRPCPPAPPSAASGRRGSCG